MALARNWWLKTVNVQLFYHGIWIVWTLQTINWPLGTYRKHGDCCYMHREFVHLTWCSYVFHVTWHTRWPYFLTCTLGRPATLNLSRTVSSLLLSFWCKVKSVGVSCPMQACYNLAIELDIMLDSWSFINPVVEVHCYIENDVYK